MFKERYPEEPLPAGWEPVILPPVREGKSRAEREREKELQREKERERAERGELTGYVSGLPDGDQMHMPAEQGRQPEFPESESCVSFFVCIRN